MKSKKMELARRTIAGALLLPCALWSAQGGAGEISGTVTDPAGTVLAGVTVTLAGAGAADSSRSTDADGVYRFTSLPDGVYELEFSRQGYATESRRGVVVTDHAAVIEEVTLRPRGEYTATLNIDSGTTTVMTNRTNVTTSTAEARPGDEAAAEDTTVTTQADLAIAMSASADPVTAGTEMVYDITVTNAGPSVARFVEVTDTLPAAVTSGSTVGCAEDPDGLPVCTLGTIAPAESARYTVTVAIGSGAVGTVINQVSVNSQTVEIGPGDESATVETLIASRADLVLTRNGASDPVVAGEALTYGIEVVNNGPSDAREVVVKDVVPAGATLESTAGCAEDPAAVPTCTLGTIPAGGSRRYSVVLAVGSAASGEVSHQASVSSTTAEASPGDESTAWDTPVEASADLVAKVESPAAVIAGNQMSYAITVRNAGPSDAREVALGATLPPAVKLVSTSGCEEDPGGAPACSLGTLPAGASRQVTVVVSVDSAALGEFTSRLDARSQTREAKPGDESISRDTAVDARADLVVTARDSVDPAVAGQPLIYTVQVLNNGPSDARDVAVNGKLPAAVSFRATDGCAEDGQPGGGAVVCSLGTIPANTAKSYAISVLVDPDATGILTTRAAVTSSTIEDRPGDEMVPPRSVPAGDPDPPSGPDAFVRQWARAWSGQRIEEYLACYSERFQPPGAVNRDEWETRRRSQIKSAKTIEVRLGAIETELLGTDQARVTFDQFYRSDRYSDTVRKTLVLVRDRGRWLIVAEQVEG